MTAKRLCGECGRTADYVVEPVGRYDCSGWADIPACDEHLGDVTREYVNEGVPRVQVRFVDVPALPEPTVCQLEGCGRLVADGDPLCLECERDLEKAIHAVAS